MTTTTLVGHLAQAWRSVKGVAGRTVARLMADLPETDTKNGLRSSLRSSQ